MPTVAADFPIPIVVANVNASICVQKLATRRWRPSPRLELHDQAIIHIAMGWPHERISRMQRTSTTLALFAVVLEPVLWPWVTLEGQG